MPAPLDIGQAVAELRRLGPNGEAARELLDLLEAADGTLLRRALRIGKRGMSEAYRARLAERDELLRACRRVHFATLGTKASAREMRARWRSYATGGGRYEPLDRSPWPPEHERWTWWRLRQLGHEPLGLERLRSILRGVNHSALRSTQTMPDRAAERRS